MALKNKTYLDLKDYSVSGEDFQLVYNEQMDMLETYPQPKEDVLSKYYESEDYISHTDSKRNLFERLYQFIRGIALKRKLRLINGLDIEDKTLLDFGCGTGDFLQFIKNRDWQVNGVEPDENARQIANKKTENKISKKLETLENQKFDIISLWHVLEHLPNLKTDIASFKKLLKPNGRLIIAVPNYKSYDAHYYKSYWAAYDVPRHLWHFSKISIERLFSEFDLEIEKTKPMIFDAYYVSLLSEKYKSGKMNPFRAFYIGLRSNLKARQTKEYSSLIYVLKNKNI